MSAIASATAGGVGGLLQAKLIDAANALCLPCYDGNGNIMAWVDGANSALIERREYDSFGSMVSIYRLATNATLHGRLAYEGLDAVIPLKEIDGDLPLSALYERVEFVADEVGE